ncbi:NTP transferase domain-containing protein [uncultured Eubacterium sp.]|uniref:NTP transferase domain-containing protein n=1 Tax=uncultured Eubacterium sp. TaxID=165185 RepID=UPI002596AB62|nr:NTP transferase domain-containing protein [uncultured Eubacterium sp.]
MKVDNAIIMAAGTASRFAPLSFEKPKALIEVRGEVLIERQIKQLQEAGITDIIIVIGYMSEQFDYLKKKYGVTLIHNSEYLTRNNNSSIYAVKKYLKNSYICSSDNYFLTNPFEKEVGDSYYSAVFVDGRTEEWCISESNGIIEKVVVGGEDSWVMLGHVFWSEEFSQKFISILEKEYNEPETANKLWETIYIDHIDELRMKIRKYPSDFIFEFDTLDELREFDKSYVKNTRSNILKKIAEKLDITEDRISDIKSFKDCNNAAAGFLFNAGKKYKYFYETQKMEEM